MLSSVLLCYYVPMSLRSKLVQVQSLRREKLSDTVFLRVIRALFCSHGHRRRPLFVIFSDQTLTLSLDPLRVLDGA